MNRLLPLGLGALFGLSLGCWKLDPTHCANNMGDASCAEGMFCDACMGPNNGCVAERPSDRCHVSDGSGTDTMVAASDTTTTITGTDTVPEPTADSTAGSMGGTTLGLDCVSDDDCQDITGTPFCDPQGQCVSCDALDDPDDACAGLDPLAPLCAGGSCVQCTDDQACSGQTPICGSANECVACTEHAECPQSACHLDGPVAGSCFDAADVFEINDTIELLLTIDQIGKRDHAVFVLASQTFDTTIGVGDDVELALLGDPSDPPVLLGDGPRVIDIFGNAIVYLAGVQVSNLSGNGIECSGTSVWVDDGQVRSNVGRGFQTSAGCATHLRRSLVLNNISGGLSMEGGLLHAQNSVIGFNGDELTSLSGGLRLDGTQVDMTYTTVVGNESATVSRGSLFCVGGESGEIRNSIIVGSGNTIDGCNAITFSNNATDDPSIVGSNIDVGAANAAWFIDLSMNNFRLSGAGQATFADVAQWQEGDPLTDADGDAIPMGRPSFPGYDQP